MPQSINRSQPVKGMQISRRVQPTQNYSRSWEWKQGDKNPKNEPIEKLSLFDKDLKASNGFSLWTTRLTISALELIQLFYNICFQDTKKLQDKTNHRDS